MSFLIFNIFLWFHTITLSSPLFVITADAFLVTTLLRHNNAIICYHDNPLDNDGRSLSSINYRWKERRNLFFNNRRQQSFYYYNDKLLLLLCGTLQEEVESTTTTDGSDDFKTKEVDDETLVSSRQKKVKRQGGKVKSSRKTKKPRNKLVNSRSSSSGLKTKTKKEKAKKINEEPAYWRQESDECSILREQQACLSSSSLDPDNNATAKNNITSVRLIVRGNPGPLVRHRYKTRGGFVHNYNPSAHKQSLFRTIVKEILFQEEQEQQEKRKTGSVAQGEEEEQQQLLLPLPLFSLDKSLAMTIVFRRKRPKTHFVGGKPGVGRLRDSAPPETAQIRTDVDNLSKFVLDSMNGLLYQDDRQITSLHITRLYDNDGECKGSTEIYLRILEESHVSALLTNTFDLY